MTDDLTRRPGTLAEAVRRCKSGQQTFSVALGEFLDEFYMDRDSGSRYARVQDPPDQLGDDVFDAYAGAVGEHLVRRWRLGTPPDWTEVPAASCAAPGFHRACKLKSRSCWSKARWPSAAGCCSSRPNPCGGPGCRMTTAGVRMNICARA
ncbi:hypothetical protein J2848_000943 [Azospirillum lipoferum]|uniref:Uncharacterized protein n=1 Tax=Azospirillum lipoferum TaxID=193 RepID=A0A5A9GY27_AZOLI|nr:MULTISPECIES: hypothetical protein [Azospirillum]KAA0598682.1 hypothetical protein FZ942_06330 [Azospirillum lipoferum]MCP1609296.1 hypothetical protein [Azospirillum lipoferum]MDW5535394.1 hypothetical protein [Azospirillum sp. NL1]